VNNGSTSYPQSVSITVTNPEGTSSNSVNETVNEPLPAISGLSPSSVPAYSAFILTVNGSNFVNGSQVRFGSGTLLSTSYVSSSQLTAAVPITVNWYRSVYPNSYSVSVVNPDGSVSNASTLAVNEPQPSIGGISPAGVTAGTAFTITVNGASFLNGAVINWNGNALSTTFVSSSRLTATVNATQNSGYSSYPQSVPVTVSNPAGTLSNTVNQTVNKPLPVISSLDPPSAPAHSAFTLTVNGSNFTPGATVRLAGGTMLATTFESSNLLTAVVPISVNWYRSSYPNSYPIAVINGDGTVSNTATLGITAP
jgi:hypothetical protein